MLHTNNSQGSQDQNQEQLGNSNRPFHKEDCASMDEFSLLLSKVSTDVLWKTLMTQQQRLMATALWEACNYGGRPKPGDLRHMEKKRDYAEWVLRIDHRQQVEKAKKQGKL
jgi:hypothetical protein